MLIKKCNPPRIDCHENLYIHKKLQNIQSKDRLLSRNNCELYNRNRRF